MGIRTRNSASACARKRVSLFPNMLYLLCSCLGWNYTNASQASDWYLSKLALELLRGDDYTNIN